MASRTVFHGDREDENPAEFLWTFLQRVGGNNDEAKKQFRYYLQADSVADEWYEELAGDEKNSWASIETAFTKRWNIRSHSTATAISSDVNASSDNIITPADSTYTNRADNTATTSEIHVKSVNYATGTNVTTNNSTNVPTTASKAAKASTGTAIHAESSIESSVIATSSMNTSIVPTTPLPPTSVAFTDFIKLASPEDIRRFLEAAGSTAEGQNLRQLWDRAFEEGRTEGRQSLIQSLKEKLDEARRSGYELGYKEGSRSKDDLYEAGYDEGRRDEQGDWIIEGHGLQCFPDPTIHENASVQTAAQSIANIGMNTDDEGIIATQTDSRSSTPVLTVNRYTKTVADEAKRCSATPTPLVSTAFRDSSTQMTVSPPFSPFSTIFSTSGCQTDSLPVVQAISSNTGIQTTPQLPRQSTNNNHTQLDLSPLFSANFDDFCTQTDPSSTVHVTGEHAITLAISPSITSTFTGRKTSTFALTGHPTSIPTIYHLPSPKTAVFASANAQTVLPLPKPVTTTKDSNIRAQKRSNRCKNRSKSPKPGVYCKNDVDTDYHSSTPTPPLVSTSPEPTTVPAMSPPSKLAPARFDWAEDAMSLPISPSSPPPNSPSADETGHCTRTNPPHRMGPARLSQAEKTVILPKSPSLSKVPPRNLSILRSPTSNPFASLQRRKKQPDNHYYQQSRDNSPFPASRKKTPCHFCQIPAYSTQFRARRLNVRPVRRPGFTSAKDEEEDTYLSSLNRVLKTLEQILMRTSTWKRGS
jgi:hypothetical protein